MFLNLRHIGQIALPVSDVDRSEGFYVDVLGLPKLYRFGDLTFFDCAGVRLLLEKAKEAIQPLPIFWGRAGSMWAAVGRAENDQAATPR